MIQCVDDGIDDRDLAALALVLGTKLRVLELLGEPAIVKTRIGLVVLERRMWFGSPLAPVELVRALRRGCLGVKLAASSARLHPSSTNAPDDGPSLTRDPVRM